MSSTEHHNPHMKEHSAEHHEHVKNREKLAEVLNKELALSHTHSHHFLPTNADEAWTRLQKGNAVWARGELSKFIAHLVPEITTGLRLKLSNDQKPYATIITCSDSRVSPELIFDEGIGLLFIVRVAGNVIDNVSLGSIEYGVDHLKTPLLLIMGHQNCGAVKATLDSVSNEVPDTHIGALLKRIRPAVDVVKAKVDVKSDYNKALDMSVQENVKIAKKATMASTVVDKLVKEGKLKVIGVEYYFDSGLVKVVD